MKEFLIEWKDAAPMIGAIIALISVTIAYVAYRSTRASARRRATLDMVMNTLLDEDVRSDYRKFRNLVREHADQATEFDMAGLAEDDAIGNSNRNIVLQQLNIYELMALGIRRGLFDEAVYKRWYHNQFMMDYEGAKSLIEAVQKKKASLYCEMTCLYKKWLKDGHPVSTPNRFIMAWWAFRRQHEKIDAARRMANSR